MDSMLIVASWSLGIARESQVVGEEWIKEDANVNRGDVVDGPEVVAAAAGVHDWSVMS